MGSQTVFPATSKLGGLCQSPSLCIGLPPPLFLSSLSLRTPEVPYTQHGLSTIKALTFLLQDFSIRPTFSSFLKAWHPRALLQCYQGDDGSLHIYPLRLDGLLFLSDIVVFPPVLYLSGTDFFPIRKPPSPQVFLN